jgi:protein-L-isoaspartate(D-aspartate) O-methyltransferase
MPYRRYFAALTAITYCSTICTTALCTAGNWDDERRSMVDECVVAAGVTDERVIAAMRAVPRHEFVTPDQRWQAYLDMCLPIGHGQTISPPFMVASMSQRLALNDSDKVLEIGTGSGYQAAVLSGMVADVYTIEIVGPLARRATATLRRLGYRNVHTHSGDGFQGWPEHAPYDKIIVTCSPEKVPQPLIDQLKEGGRMVVPVGERYQQVLYLFRKSGGRLEAEASEPTMFVPMLGIAEAKRVVKDDPASPALVNGRFEQALVSKNDPAGWYYVRQARLEFEAEWPERGRYLALANATPGRDAQALQALGVDGREVAELAISFWVRIRDVEVGATSEQWPRFLVTFYDADRAPIGQAEVGPWSGGAPWTRQRAGVKVPRSARLAVVTLGMLGATGHVDFDDVELRAAGKVAMRPK